MNPGGIITLGLIAGAVLLSVAGLVAWGRKMRAREDAAAGHIQEIREQLRADYGVRPLASHVRAAIASPSGSIMRAEMRDGSLRVVLLWGKDPVPYIGDGESWIPMPRIDRHQEPSTALPTGEN